MQEFVLLYTIFGCKYRLKESTKEMSVIKSYGIAGR